MKKSLSFLLLSISFVVFAQHNSLPIYLDDSKSIEERIGDALSRMTLDEKVAMCHAQSKFSSAGVPRLGIPDNWMTDGPHGIRPEVLWDKWDQAEWTNDSCTAFPALTCLAASWNEEISLLYGRSIGAEARYRNKNVLLGPGVNIYRSPLNGRNFEYMGEDPYLASKMVVPYIKGVQENGVAACVKHYALNNSEINRHYVDVNVDDRALYEIYLPAFKASVQEGGAWAIMGSYNRYKGQWGCHNEYLLNDILRDQWGFDGVVVSDWGGVKETHQAVYNGLDMEFGTWTDGLTMGATNAYQNYYLAAPFRKLLLSGEVDEEELNKKVRNILRLSFRTTMDRNRSWGAFGTDEHMAAARKIAEEGVVLLKNDRNILPIDLNKTKKILVVGENAIKKMTVGGGSSSLKARYEISPLDGLKTRIPAGVQVEYVRGYVGDTSSSYNNVTTGQDLKDDRSKAELIQEACAKAADADIVLFVGGLNKARYQDSESQDRKSLGLPYAQDELITELAKVNNNLAVILVSGNAVSMPWIDHVPSIVQAWYLGSESGNALASILTGDVNPSGKLPFSFPVELNDIGAHYYNEFPGDSTVNYKEGVLVGYRWLEKRNIKPLFPFGHGLSYTTFDYGKLRTNSKQLRENGEMEVSVTVKNSGQRMGKEVVQLYVEEVNPAVLRPVKELKAFKKIELRPGEEQVVHFSVDQEMLQYYDDVQSRWRVNPGKFKLHVGTSSEDIKETLSFNYK